jgi:hypothetical protein
MTPNVARHTLLISQQVSLVVLQAYNTIRMLLQMSKDPDSQHFRVDLFNVPNGTVDGIYC